MAHSLSPHIHQLFAQQFGIELRYTRSLSSAARFARTVSEFFRHGGYGANVTVPFKQAAFALCSQRSVRAQAAGAVNTLVQGSNGQLYGDNTDGVGLVADLQRQLGSLQGRRVVIIGAGGASRGVVLPLLQAGVAAMTIANRTKATANQLIDQFNHALSGQQLDAMALCELTPQHCDQAIVVNATSAGWSDQQLAMDAGCFAAAGLVYDMNYCGRSAVVTNTRRLTPLLQQAEQAGASRYSDGLGMLVEQAAASFALWHQGVEPATEPVLQQLRELIQN